MTSKPILFSYFRSSCSWRVRIVLFFKGIEYDLEPVNLIQDAQNSEKYKKINPHGKVPALAINGHTLSQSVSIMEYLEEIHPNPPLLPKDPILRAKVRAIIESITSDIQPLQNLMVLKYLEEDKRQEWGKHWITRGFHGIEKALSEVSGKYCFGDILTLADVCLVPQVYNAGRFNVDMSEFPILSSINKELMKLDCFKLTQPSKQLDCPDDLKATV